MNYSKQYLLSLKKTNGSLENSVLAQQGTEPFISIFIKGSWLVLVASVIFQCAFFLSLNNLFAIECIILAWSLNCGVFLKPAMLKNYPLSSFLIIGFVITQFYLPLLFTSLENKPVVFNLDLSFQVFFHSIAALLVVTMAHYIYRTFLGKQKRNQHSILVRLKIFEPPAAIQIWVIGCIGLVSSYYVYFAHAIADKGVTGAAGDKLIESLIPFSYAPFFIPIGKLYGGKEKIDNKLWLKLAVYTVLLFIMSIGRNSRGAFMLGFTSIAFAYFIGLITNVFKSDLFTAKNAMIALLSLWLITGPIADLGVAMVIVRGERNDVKATELVSLTLNTFMDKKALKSRKEQDKELQEDWDERYLNNIFTARFSNLKYNDESLILASKIAKDNPAMRKYTIDNSLSQFPQPLLDALNVNVDKTIILNQSFGDYLYNQAGGTGDYNAYRTGHFAGTGMAAFGWWYLLILGVGMLPVFFLFDKLVFIKRARTVEQTNMRFSFCGLLALTSIFQFLSFESVAMMFGFLVRGWVQLILSFFILFQVTRVFTLPMFAGQHKKARNYKQI